MDWTEQKGRAGISGRRADRQKPNRRVKRFDLATGPWNCGQHWHVDHNPTGLAAATEAVNSACYRQRLHFEMFLILSLDNGAIGVTAKSSQQVREAVCSSPAAEEEEINSIERRQADHQPGHGHPHNPTEGGAGVSRKAPGMEPTGDQQPDPEDVDRRKRRTDDLDQRHEDDRQGNILRGVAVDADGLQHGRVAAVTDIDLLLGPNHGDPDRQQDTEQGHQRAPKHGV